MKPQLATLARKHGDKVVVLLVHVNQNSNLAMKAGVRSIPDTRLVLGGKELERVVGGYPIAHFEKLINKHAGSLSVEARVTPSGKSSGGEAITPMKEDWLPPGVTVAE